MPAGSIAVAGRQAVICPLRSPGGWPLLGRTPLRVLDLVGPARQLSPVRELAAIDDADRAELAHERVLVVTGHDRDLFIVAHVFGDRDLVNGGIDAEDVARKANGIGLVIR